MARSTRNYFNFNSSTLKLARGIGEALATLASGKNADATDYTLPVNHAGVTATAVATGTGDSSGAAVAAATGLRLMGYSVRESAGSAAVASFNLRNGTADTAPIVAVEELAANASTTRWFGPNGINCASGVFLDRVSGETEIVLYTAVIV